MIGARLRQLRNRENLTLSSLAKFLGTTPMTISRYENNQRQPDNETLKKIATYFDVSVDFLLSRTDIPSFAICESNVKKIPIYNLFHMESNSEVPESSMDIATSSYDFVLDFDKLIGVHIFKDDYIPYFYGQDILIFELTDKVEIRSQYYLVKYNSGGYSILELISNREEYIFTHLTNYSKVIVNQDKFKVVGRIISLIRNF